jgi:uncharacterized membrane protein
MGFLAKYLGGYGVWALYGLAVGSTPLIVVDLIGICASSVTVGVALRVRRRLRQVGRPGTPAGLRAPSEPTRMTP